MNWKTLLKPVQGLLGSVFNLFPRQGSNGGLVIRKVGGTPGTDEGQLYYTSNEVYLANAQTAAGKTVRIIGGGETTEFDRYKVWSRGFKWMLGNNNDAATPFGLGLSSDAVAAWQDGTSLASGSKDTAIARAAAGQLYVTNASSTNYLQFGLDSSQNALVRAINPTQASASMAGNTLTLRGSDATAGSSSAGAAAGGSLNLTAGDAKRLTSGNANGGDVVVTPGALIGSGTDGSFIIRKPGGTPGTDELQIYHDGTHVFFFNKDTGDYNAVLQRNKSFGMRDQTAGGNLRAYFLMDGNGEGEMHVGGTTEVRASASTNHKGLIVGSNGYIGFDSASNASGTHDTSFNRLVAGVFGLNTIGSTTCWLQQTAGHKALDANATSTSDTLADTNLTWTLKAGRTYSICLKLSGGDSTAGEGAKFALTSDGTLSATTFDLSVIGTNGPLVAGTTRVTSLGSAINYTTFTATSDLYLVGEIKVNVAGTIKLQMATNAHVAGTLTLNAGSWGKFDDLVAV